MTRSGGAGPGPATTMAWEPDGDLLSLGHTTASGPLGFTYGHDPSGKVTSVGVSDPALEWLLPGLASPARDRLRPMRKTMARPMG